MLSLFTMLLALTVQALSGLATCLPGLGRRAGERLAAYLLIAGGGLGLAALGRGLWAGDQPRLDLAWGLPWGRFTVALDALSGIFLVPVFLLPALVAWAGLGPERAPASEHGRRLSLALGLLAAAMGLLVLARDAVLFLMAWEIMALAAWFAATSGPDRPALRRAGWIYLIATHLGTLCLFAALALWIQGSGGTALAPAQTMSLALASPIFVLGLLGFGAKAGLVPLHSWLPETYGEAPAPVSAILSGAVSKMGIYGLVRLTALLPVPELWWGGTLLAIGMVTAVLGIAYALAQDELKRLLAYSSIENIGVIAMGLGLALLGRTQARADWVILGLGSALLHVWNHGLCKALLFLGAGEIERLVGETSLNRLGGLGQRLPRLTGLFIIGALGISALPPLNGFVSEWLLYLGCARTLGFGPGSLPVAASGAVVLALVGALATATFVKLLGTGLLGAPRTPALAEAREGAWPAALPMISLALGCLALGLLGHLTVPWLTHATRVWAGEPLAATVPLADLLIRLSLAQGGLLVLLFGAWLGYRAWRPVVVRQALTWDCGYARPTARMQYTGASFSQFIGQLTHGWLRPRRAGPVIRGYFTGASQFQQRVPDWLLQRVLEPSFALAGRWLPWLRLLQQGQTQLYMLYVLIIVIVLLGWGALEVQP